MDVILYHKSCPDGFCAAYIAKKRYPEAQLVALDHGGDKTALISSLSNLDVLMVDFSLRTREENDAIAATAKSFLILDHHKTAEAVLAGAPYAVFDMNRSGAGLAWDYLFGKDNNKAFLQATWHSEYNPSVWRVERPWYVDYVEDRDLWRHILPNSREVSAFIMTLPFSEEAWSVLDTMTAEEAAVKGEGALAHVEHYVREIVRHAQLASKIKLNGVVRSIAVVNAPYLNCSEVGNVLATEQADIGMSWFERGDGIVQFSLRSTGDIDISVIAKHYGGGGHKNAAGFQISLTESREFLDQLLGRGTREIFEYPRYAEYKDFL